MKKLLSVSLLGASLLLTGCGNTDTYDANAEEKIEDAVQEVSQQELIELGIKENPTWEQLVGFIDNNSPSEFIHVLGNADGEFMFDVECEDSATKFAMVQEYGWTGDFVGAKAIESLTDKGEVRLMSLWDNLEVNKPQPVMTMEEVIDAITTHIEENRYDFVDGLVGDEMSVGTGRMGRGRFDGLAEWFDIDENILNERISGAWINRVREDGSTWNPRNLISEIGENTFVRYEIREVRESSLNEGVFEIWIHEIHEPNVDTTGVYKANFQQIQEGMTLEQVTALLGSYSSTSTTGNMTVKTWTRSDFAATISISFIDGVVWSTTWVEI